MDVLVSWKRRFIFLSQQYKLISYIKDVPIDRVYLVDATRVLHLSTVVYFATLCANILQLDLVQFLFIIPGRETSFIGETH